MDWLRQNLSQDAAATLKKFDERIGYQGFLRDTSGFAQTGEGRAANVRAFTDYAKEKGDVLAFMGQVKQLADERVGQEAYQTGQAVSLDTMHRSKGLEWSLVLVPHVNEAIYPFNGAAASNEEEERRLLYVALTRTKRDLHLFQLEKEPISPFLRQAQSDITLQQVQALHHALNHPTHKNLQEIMQRPVTRLPRIGHFTQTAYQACPRHFGHSLRPKDESRPDFLRVHKTMA